MIANKLSMRILDLAVGYKLKNIQKFKNESQV